MPIIIDGEELTVYPDGLLKVQIAPGVRHTYRRNLQKEKGVHGQRMPETDEQLSTRVQRDVDQRRVSRHIPRRYSHVSRSLL